MHVRVQFSDQPDLIISVESELIKIEDFRCLIEAKCKVDPKHQRLFYGGKLLENGHTFHDYDIKENDVVHMSAVTESKEDEKEMKISEDLSDGKAKIVYEDAKSNLYAVGDLVDMTEEELGAWFEGTIIGIVKDPNFIKPKTLKNQRDATEEENSKCTTSLEQIKISSENEKKQTNDYVRKSKKSSDQELENLKTDFGLLYKVHV